MGATLLVGGRKAPSLCELLEDRRCASAVLGEMMLLAHE